MTLKIKLKGEHASVRWNNPMEKEFFKMVMVNLRDSDPKTHPVMTVKDEANKEIIRPKMMMPQVKPVEIAVKPTQETTAPVTVDKPAEVIRYYTREQLKQEGKVACDECIHRGENEGCKLVPSLMITPENSYLNINGAYLGCIHGVKKDEGNKVQ
jgi:hypothetical protein